MHVPFTDTLIAAFQQRPLAPPRRPSSATGGPPPPPPPSVARYIRGLVSGVASGGAMRAAAAAVLQVWVRRVPQLLAVGGAAAGDKAPLGKRGGKREAAELKVFPRDRRLAVPAAVALGVAPAAQNTGGAAAPRPAAVRSCGSRRQSRSHPPCSCAAKFGCCGPHLRAFASVTQS